MTVHTRSGWLTIIAHLLNALPAAGAMMLIVSERRCLQPLGAARAGALASQPQRPRGGGRAATEATQPRGPCRPPRRACARSWAALRRRVLVLAGAAGQKMLGFCGHLLYLACGVLLRGVWGAQDGHMVGWLWAWGWRRQGAPRQLAGRMHAGSAAWHMMAAAASVVAPGRGAGGQAGGGQQQQPAGGLQQRVRLGGAGFAAASEPRSQPPRARCRA
jgi:hypothetical protein